MPRDLSPIPDKAKHNRQSSPSAEPTEFGRLDARLKNLSDNIIQISPYILTVPSTRPYRLDQRQVHEWRRGTPFEEHEEQLQYLSFLLDWDNGLITPVGSWDNESGEIMDRSLSQQSAKSGTSTPATGTKKVKHSLSEYMKKTASGQGTSKESKKEDHKLSNGSATGYSKDMTPHKERSQSLKRSREDVDTPEAENSQLAKKARPSPPKVPTATRRAPDLKGLDLPPLISPTLPPIIEKELARLSSLEGKTKQKAPASTRKESAHGDAERSPERQPKVKASETSDKPRPNGVSKHNSTDKPAKSGSKDSIGLSNGAVSKADKASEPTSRLSKIVRLRIPKSIRTNVSRLLKTSQPRQKHAEPSHASQNSVSHTDRLSPMPEPRKIKHSRSDDDTDDRSPPLKRPKHPSGLDVNSKPSTPVPPAFRSPTVSQHGSAQKKPSTTSHPFSDAKTVAPHHADEPSVSTPQGAIRNGTPSAPDSAERSTKRIPLSRELREIERQHWDLGKASKRSSDAEINRAEGRKSSASYKRGLALGLECILAFMLSYAVRDEMNRGQRRAVSGFGSGSGKADSYECMWTTIYPYIGRIKGLAEPYPLIRGLTLQLEAVCRMASWANACERAEAAEATAAAAAAAGSSSAAVSSTESAGYAQSQVMKHYVCATELFVDGAELLPTEALQRSFPEAWKNKARVPLVRTQAQRFDPKVDGDFYLPLSGISTAVEAVRAGKAILTEWSKKDELEWTTALGRPRNK